MKKLFVFAIATLFAFSMSAQKYGVKAGYNMAAYTVNFYTPDGAAMGGGIYAGLVGEMPVNDMMSLRVDLGFNQLGSNYDSRGDLDEDWVFRALGVEYDYQTKVNYLNIGVSPKFNFGPAYAFVGPYFAYALSSNKTETWEGTSLFSPTPGTGTSDIFSEPNESYNGAEAYSDDNNLGGSGDLYNKVDFGLNLGFGVNFSGVFVEANVGYGLMNFINLESDNYDATGFATKDDKTVAITGDVAQNNLFFGISVGYLLGGE